MTHPVLDMQRALNNGGSPHTARQDDGYGVDDFTDFIDNTPRAVGIAVAVAAVTLFLLKRAGFRFNFGVGANIGK